jgi:hypothetical protein
MGFIHHITGAAGATGLMGGAARSPGSVRLEHTGRLVTKFPGLPIGAARIGDCPLCRRLRRAPEYTVQTIDNHARAAWIERLLADAGTQLAGALILCNHTLTVLPERGHAERAAAPGEPQPGREAANSNPLARFRVVKGQDH